MLKSNNNSRIAIWSKAEVNYLSARYKLDKNTEVIQIEYAGDNNYIVEIIDIKEEEI